MSQDFLSQEEVDCLLKGVCSEDDWVEAMSEQAEIERQGRPSKSKKPKVQKSTVDASWIVCETIVERKRYDLQLVNWMNGEGSDLHVVTGSKEHTLSLPSEAWAALRILLKKHGGFGKDWFNESHFNCKSTR